VHIDKSVLKHFLAIDYIYLKEEMTKAISASRCNHAFDNVNTETRRGDHKPVSAAI
jgi:hypothetical protein